MKLITKNMQAKIFNNRTIPVTYNGKKIGVAYKNGANIEIAIEDDNEIARMIKHDNVTYSLEVHHEEI